jgi:hypothetical protein
LIPSIKRVAWVCTSGVHLPLPAATNDSDLSVMPRIGDRFIAWPVLGSRCVDGGEGGALSPGPISDLQSD